MDSVTQALLGGSVGGLVLGRRLGRGAVLGGALLGTVPDMDVVIDYGDAVSNFTQHRGFSHSFLVLLPLAWLLAWLLHRWRPQVCFSRWFTFTALVLLTHPLLDAFTTYGTQLLWPFGEPYGLSTIFIIDPLYTLPLLVGCILAIWRPPGMRALAVGLTLSTLYLGWALVGQYLITQRVLPVLAEQGMEDAPRMVQPMPFSTVLWRATVMGETERLEIVTGFLDGSEPLQVDRYPRNRELARVAESIPAGARLDWFTDGFLSYEAVDGKLVATDVRLGLPGTHPFRFVLAVRGEGRWEPVESYRLPRDAINPQTWRFLVRRTLGQPAVPEKEARTPADLGMP